MRPLTIENVKKALLLNVDPDRDFLNEPFALLDKDCATEGHVLACFPKSGLYKSPADEHKYFRVKAMMRLDNLKSEVINLDLFTKLIQRLKKETAFDYKECDECSGTGEVDYEYDYDRKTYSVDGECPKCEGTGDILIPGSGKPVVKEYIKIGNAVINGNYLQQAYETFVAADFLDHCDEIIVLSGGAEDAVRIAAGDALVGILPLMANSDEREYAVTFEAILSRQLTWQQSVLEA